MSMSFLQSHERRHLLEACAAATIKRRTAVRPNLVEPTWTALLARDETSVALACFLPGDPEDPVRSVIRIAKDKGDSLKDLTLYLTIEPSSTYQRLPSVTEYIHGLGIKRVVIGTENPAPRLRGKGIEALRKQGLEVLLANGEEARACQLLYEDYGKVMNRSLPYLRLVWDLAPVGLENYAYELEFRRPEEPVFSDAVLVRAEKLAVSAAELQAQMGSTSTLVVLDEKGNLDLNQEGRRTFAEKMIVALPGSSNFDSHAKDLSTYGALVIRVALREGHLDLALVLRRLCECGVFSIVCRGDAELYLSAIHSGLVDSVLARLHSAESPAQILSRISQARIMSRAGGQGMELLSPRLMAKAEENVWVEAGLRLQ